MRILHVIHSHCKGRLETLVIDLARALNENGIESQIAFIREEGEDFPTEKCEGMRTHLIDRRGTASCVRTIGEVIKKENINIAHSHDPESLLPATLAAKLSFKKCLHTKHVRTYKRVGSLLFNLNTFVVCASEDARKDLLAYSRVAEKRIRIVYNGIDLAAVDNALDKKHREDLRREFGFDNGTFVIGNFGRLVKEEDQASIIKALKKMVSRELDAKLLIVGDGRYKEEVLKVADEYGVKDRVTIVDETPRPAMLNAIDCLVVAAFDEGRPYTLLEAMAARKPVIATAVGANPEVIEERKNGYLVACGFPERIHSAVMRMKAIETLPAELGEAGRRKVEERFTLEKMANDYKRLYKQM